MSLKFTKTMFNVDPLILGCGGLITSEFAAEKSQKAFDEWLESQPIMWGRIEGDSSVFTNTKISGVDTHTARLMNIEPIEKPCEHKGIYHKGFDGWACSKCSQKLRATGWEEVK